MALLYLRRRYECTTKLQKGAFTTGQNLITEFYEYTIIASEDTRKTSLRLKHFAIQKAQTSFYQHNERRVEIYSSYTRTTSMIALIKDGSFLDF
jgi:16S rRNA C1402 (ribose-2'-O) methylase RsmI